VMDDDAKEIVAQAMEVARRAEEQLHRERERFHLEKLFWSPANAEDVALAQVLRRWHRYGQLDEDWQSVLLLLETV